MKTHSLLGTRALERAVRDAKRSLEFLDIARQLVHFHHEKWDGSGYPEGRKWDAIPNPARLMALSDVSDALISRRVYKLPIPVDRALSIIASERWHHFDPDVVDAFLVDFADFVAVAQRYQEGEASGEMRLR